MYKLESLGVTSSSEKPVPYIHRKNKSDSKLFLRIILFIYFPAVLMKINLFFRDNKKLFIHTESNYLKNFDLFFFANFIQRCRLKLAQANSLESDLWYRETLKCKWRSHTRNDSIMESLRLWFQWNVLLDYMWLMKASKILWNPFALLLG